MRELVEGYFAEMQRGPDGLEALLALFADDAVYTEPFSGGGPHVGREAIRAYLVGSSLQAPPQLRVVVERVDVDGDTVEAIWRCESPAFARPSRGHDRFIVRDGAIVQLVTTLLVPPCLVSEKHEG